MKTVITADTVSAHFEQGRRSIPAPRSKAIITPAAWSRAHELGVTLDQSAAELAVATPQAGSCDRTVDASGLIVVRGNSVQLGNFAAAGPNRNVGLLDLVTGKDGSPMTAGIMSWSRADNFPWKLDYDEVDYVLEGILQITIDGRTHQGKPGDVIYIPKGSAVLFGTPSHTRVFYVTYPADWAAPAPARPQR
jgi:ethanolamine utilization protein EutQ